MFDSPRSARTNPEKIAVFRAEHKDMASIKGQFLVRVATAYDFYLKTIPAKNGRPKPPRYKARERGKYLNEPQCRSFVLWLLRWNEALHKWMIGERGIVAAIFVGWKTEPKFATEFWGHTFLEDAEKSNDPTRVLSRKLLEVRKGRGKEMQDTFYKKTITAWNDYLKQRTEPPPLPRRR
jgi:hypothetical protein